MQHSTPQIASPRKETLEFIKYFAHNYRCLLQADGSLHEMMLG